MSFRRGLFREEAAAHRGKPEPLDGLLRVTAPHEWLILVALGLSALGIVAWALLGTVERDLNAACALALAGERYRIASPTSGRTLEVLAREGDLVEAGEPIARIQARGLDHEVSAARARVDLLEAYLQAGDPAFIDVLSAARAELVDLEARRESGGYVVSPHDGEVAAQNLVLGGEVAEGAEVAVVRSLTERRFEAVTLVPEAEARQLDVGMESQVIRASAATGDARVLEAEVAHVSVRPATSTGWLASFGLDAPAAGGHLVRLALSEPAPATVSDGEPCRLRVVLGRESPLSILGSPSAAGADSESGEPGPASSGSPPAAGAGR